MVLYDIIYCWSMGINRLFFKNERIDNIFGKEETYEVIKKRYDSWLDLCDGLCYFFVQIKKEGLYWSCKCLLWNLQAWFGKKYPVRNNKYSSVVGNIIYFINKMQLRNIDYSMADDYEYEEEHKIMNNTMLGKVFGYFFND